jgi:DNA polymerase III alpha subunit (gram-positive type)
MVASMNDLVFLDTETTGLDANLHEVWQVAWAINEENPVQERILVHSLKTANLKSLEMNHYLEHHPEGARSEGPMVDLAVRQVLQGATLVCANPPFDRMFLWKRWGYEPWHYRSIDVESMALAVLEHDRPKGLKDIADELRELGYNIGEPTHAAWADVVVLRESYRALRDIQKQKNDSLMRIGFTPDDFKPSYGRDIRNEPRQAN